MGAKTWMIVYSDDQPSNKFKRYPKPDLEKTISLLNRLFPNEKLEKTDDGDLSFTCPPNDMIYAGHFDGISVVAAKEFGIDNPSKIDRRFISESPFKKPTYMPCTVLLIGLHLLNGKMVSLRDLLAFRPIAES